MKIYRPEPGPRCRGLARRLAVRGCWKPERHGEAVAAGRRGQLHRPLVRGGYRGDHGEPEPGSAPPGPAGVRLSGALGSALDVGGVDSGTVVGDGEADTRPALFDLQVDVAS